MTMKLNSWTYEEEEIVKSMYGFSPHKRILAKLCFRTDAALRAKASSLGCKGNAKLVGGLAKKGIYRRKYIRNYFDVIDEERAYWAGFIAADGCIFRNSLKITLAKKDKCQLEKFSSVYN